MFSVVQEDRNVFLLKAMNIFDVFHHVHGIVVTSRELPLLSDVVDPNNDGTASSRRVVGDNLKLLFDIKRTRGGELRDLRVATFLENVSHLEKDFLEGQVRVGGLFISIQDLEHGRSTRSTGLTIRVGQL